MVLAGSFGWAPAGGLGLRALIAALRLQMKVAGGAHLDRIDAEAFLAQVAEYEGAGDLRDGVLKLLNTERSTHRFSVVRAAELQRWAASEEFGRILAGDYPLRADDRDASFSDNAREAARTYRTRIEESTDLLVGAVRNVGATVGTAAESVVDWFNRVARGPEPAGRHATDDPCPEPEPTPDPGM